MLNNGKSIVRYKRIKIPVKARVKRVTLFQKGSKSDVDQAIILEKAFIFHQVYLKKNSNSLFINNDK